MMNKRYSELVEQYLLKFPGKDVLVYFNCRNLKPGTFGFYIWNGNSHSQTTISELLHRDGFEKSEIKELRNEAAKIYLVENMSGDLEIIEGKER